MDIIIGQREVDAYLREHRVQFSEPVDAVLGQIASREDQPVVLIVITLPDQRKMVAFTSLQRMEAACATIRAAWTAGHDG